MKQPPSTELGPNSSVDEIAENPSQEVKTKFSLRVFRYGTRTDIILIIVSFVLNFASGLLMPIFMTTYGGMMDSFGGVQTDRDLMWYIRFLIYLGIAAFALGWGGATAMEYTAERQLRTIKMSFVEAITRQEMGWFDQFDGGELATKLNECLKVIRDAVGIKISQVFMFTGIFLGGYVVGLWNGWQLALVITATLPLLVLSGLVMMRTLAGAGANARKAYAAAGAVAEESFSTIRSIAAFGLEKKRINDFTGKLDASFGSSVKEAAGAGIGLASTMAVLFFTYALGLWYGSKLVADDMDEFGARCTTEPGLDCFTGGKTMTVFFAIVMAAFAIGQSGPAMSALGKATSAVEDIEKITKRESSINPHDDSGHRQGTPLQGNIEFQHVGFAYPTRDDRRVFKDLNLVIPAGQSVALVGASGCGKSTIIQLVERFYDPLSGAVKIDGRDIRDWNLKWLRNQIALVGQEPRLFADTIHTNIAVGRPGASEDDIVAAAKAANAHSFIMEFPNQYNTYVGEGGGQLSGGQKQRIAIARAILRDPSILILDEATSALDNESEKIVQETLDAVVAQKKRTTIIIAHRLSTVRKADRILVLDNEGDGGVVKEEGTHEELINISGGIYAQLVHAQVGDEKTDTVTEIAESFQQDLPRKSQSVVRLRSKFSRLHSRLSRTDSATKATEKQEPRMVKWLTVAKNLTPFWPYILLGLVGAILNGLVWPLFSVLFSKFSEAFYLPTSGEVRDEGRKWSLIFIAYGVGVFLAHLLQHFGFGWTGHKIVRILREKTFSAIIQQDMEFFDDPEHTSGVLSEMLSSGILSVKGWVGDNIGIYTQNVISIIAAVIISFLASAKLAAVALATFLVMAPASLIEARFLSGGDAKGSKEGDVNVESAAFILNETIINIRTIAAYTYEDKMIHRYHTVVNQAFEKGAKKSVWGGLAWGISQGLQYFGNALCMWYGGKLIESGEISLSNMLQAIFALLMTAMGLGQTMILATDISEAQLAATRVYSVINRRPVINVASDDGRALAPLQDGVKFNTVNFRYPQRPDVPVYRDLTFEIKKGEVVALVGSSGCGKSTAVQLLERFYDVSDAYTVDLTNSKGDPLSSTHGSITIDDIDIRDLNVNSLRAQMGLVNQEPVLFNTSIAENIALGKIGGADINEVMEAAKKANAYDFIRNLPDGYETKVGSLGGRLSGGQKQRIAIARAIIRDPSILILDEATSALDTESERIVQAALDELLVTQKRSTVVIAHRLTTVRNANKIVVLANKHGRGSVVAEVGTHDELMDINDGIYRGLVKIAEGR